MSVTPKDIDYFKRSRECIAQGALTNSKRSSSFVEGVYPAHFTRAQDCYSITPGGETYIDFIMALGAHILGHKEPSINLAIAKQLQSGSLYSLGSTLEIEFAEMIKSLFPFIDKIKVFKTGSEAASCSIRIARSATGRMNIVHEGYSGWHDTFVAATPPAAGIPEELKEYISRPPVNAAVVDKIAAVILEPIITDISEERISYLHRLREICTRNGVLLIFDETITMLRFPNFSVATTYGIIPDLIIGGKALGGGLPLSVVGGKKELMDGEYFCSSTFSGDTLAMAASMELIRILKNEAQLLPIIEASYKFQKGFNEIAMGVVQLEGYGMRCALSGEQLSKALFMQEACKAGLLFGASFFFAKAHMSETDNVLNLVKTVCSRIRAGSVTLEGKLPVTPFAQRVREHE